MNGGRRTQVELSFGQVQRHRVGDPGLPELREVPRAPSHADRVKMLMAAETRDVIGASA